ncbi:MAG: hypothetical protein E7606_02115 [Ruminococcaceae bacterium]|nr:hypothetical protein [Oscillospiraceae bacterium]
MIDITVPFEYTVEQKSEGTLRWKRLALLALYFAYPIVLIFVVGSGTAALIAPLLAFIPLSLWIIIFLTWRYVKISYQYTVTSGRLCFIKHYGNRTHKTQFEMALKDAKLIAPVGHREHDERLELFAPEMTYNGVSSKNAPDTYYIAFENAEGKRCVFFFEATTKALELFKMYNPKTVVVKVRY